MSIELEDVRLTGNYRRIMGGRYRRHRSGHAIVQATPERPFEMKIAIGKGGTYQPVYVPIN